MRLELVTVPGSEPVSLVDAKLHLRVDSVAEDALITRHISAARRQVEAHLRRKLITQTWALYLDSFCGPIVFPDLAPVASVDWVKYVDQDGALQTLSAGVYQLLKESPARLVLAYGQEWPAIRGDREGVRIQVACGYGVAAAVPENITAAILLLVEHLYFNRGPVDLADGSWAALLSEHVVAEF